MRRNGHSPLKNLEEHTASTSTSVKDCFVLSSVGGFHFLTCSPCMCLVFGNYISKDGVPAMFDSNISMEAASGSATGWFAQSQSAFRSFLICPCFRSVNRHLMEMSTASAKQAKTAVMPVIQQNDPLGS